MLPLSNWYRSNRSSALLLSVALHIGCQSAGYRAERLPQELRAAPAQSNSAINLAQFTSPGSGNSLLSPGDLLEITISTGREDEKKEPALARVADDGTVLVPIVGPVPVAGLEEFDASQNIARLGIERGMYRHPLVTVEIKSKAVNRITVMGAVHTPGVHELPRGGSDLVSALAAAGGLDDSAGTEVEIIRQPRFGLTAQQKQRSAAPSAAMEEIQLAAYQNVDHLPSPPVGNSQFPGWQGSQTIRLDLSQANLASRSGDYRLGDRDIVHVMPRKKSMIYVAGLVNKPGQFDLPVGQDLRLLDGIALAGGRSSPVADKILIIRHDESRPQPLAIQASLSKAKQSGLENLRLAAGDTITVEQTPTTAVVDTFTKFFRFSVGAATRTVF